MTLSDAFERVKTGRAVHGISATLLPYTPGGDIDWDGYERHLRRTRSAGLDVAVNMDTGFGDLLTIDERRQVLAFVRRTLGPGVDFYAGAFADPASDDLVGSYHAAMRAIDAHGGIPVIVQDRRMHALGAGEKVELYRELAEGAERSLAFELGPAFAARGEIWDDETFERIVEIPRIAGAKHSSLDRVAELRRLAIRDRVRPDFRVYTGNDLAIDMVLFGSDYLLGLSTFAPAAFAARDRALREGDVSFLQLNDALQYLGNVGFRAPVPAYKHSAAQYLHITGRLESDAIHPRAPRRPGSDRVMLLDCAVRLGEISDPKRAYAERVAPYLEVGVG